MIAAPALAAPDRLSDIIPDAVPDLEGKLNVSWNHQQLDLEGPFSDSSSSHDYLKLKYTFSPTTAASIRYGSHDLSGDLGIVSPLFDNKDSASSLEFDFAINLLNMEAVPADPANNVPFGAGSALNLGVAATFYQLDEGPISQNETLLKAYLAYSTDLTEKLRAHTYFSTGRLSGDNASGSVNRIAAGLDYELIDGCRPLVLMADGILDVYNFRQPSFNTSRLSQFNIGLRYKFADQWYGSLGWQTINDSENDASGSGLFAGVNFVDEECYCEQCAAGFEHEAEEEVVIGDETQPAPEVPAESPPAPETEPAPAEDPPTAEAPVEEAPVEEALVEETPAEEVVGEEVQEEEQAPGQQEPSEETPVGEDTLSAGSGETIARNTNAGANPPMMNVDASADAANEAVSEALAEPSSDAASEGPDDSGMATGDASVSAAVDELSTDAGQQPAAADAALSAGAEPVEGVTIPPFPLEVPRFTPFDAVIVRPPPSEYVRELQQDAATESLAPALVPAAPADADSIEVVTVDDAAAALVSSSTIAAARQLLAGAVQLRQRG
jgi:hypothetical protein